jgi:acyl carrier protein
MTTNKKTREMVMAEMETIFRDVLDNDAIALKDETTASDIAEWDSLNHIALMVSIEGNFNVRFMANEIQNFKNVGEICDLIVARQ